MTAGRWRWDWWDRARDVLRGGMLPKHFTDFSLGPVCEGECLQPVLDGHSLYSPQREITPLWEDVVREDVQIGLEDLR